MSMTNASTNTTADNVNRTGHGSPRQIIHMRPMTHTLPAKRQGYTRFVLLSDSHTHTYPVPDGDVLIHAGDLTEHGTTEELQVTVDWLSALPHPHKVMIAGNHDHCLDEETLLADLARYDQYRRSSGSSSSSSASGAGRSKKQRQSQRKTDKQAAAAPSGSSSEASAGAGGTPLRNEIYENALAILDSPAARSANLVYLKDAALHVPRSTPGSGVWRIWGSPWSAAFCSMAFNVPRGPASAQLYAGIPGDTDVLVSHGPPYGVLDRIARDARHVGCDRLRARTAQIRPRLHVWGHIHEDRGVVVDDGSERSKREITPMLTEGKEGDGAPTGTVYVNAANAGTFVRPRLWGIKEYQPIVVDLRDRDGDADPSSVSPTPGRL